MSLYKRNKVWHADFSVNGQRFRVSLDTTDWREAQAKEKEKIAQAADGKLAPNTNDFSRLGFGEAAERYLKTRKLELGESSFKKESALLVQPKSFFEATKLSKIRTESLLAYRDWRAETKVKPITINMEMGAIRRILKRAKRWHLVSDGLKPLKERGTVGRAMPADEKTRLERIAKSNPDWQTARLAMVLALNTTMRGCELKSLQWGDIDLMEKKLTIGKSKTEAGERVIPLNSTAYAVMLELRERAKSFHGIGADHFIFPACENGHIDPTRPQKSWRSAWRSLTRAIECPACGVVQHTGKVCRNSKCKADITEVKSPTAGFRFHDLRHHAITELAESQASDSTIMSIAGHVSQKMLQHYSHVRLDAKRDALEALSRHAEHRGNGNGRGTTVAEQTEEGYVTNHVTNAESAGHSTWELTENNGRPEWTRTIDLFRVKEAL